MDKKTSIKGSFSWLRPSKISTNSSNSFSLTSEKSNSQGSSNFYDNSPPISPNLNKENKPDDMGTKDHSEVLPSSSKWDALEISNIAKEEISTPITSLQELFRPSLDDKNSKIPNKIKEPLQHDSLNPTINVTKSPESSNSRNFPRIESPSRPKYNQNNINQLSPEEINQSTIQSAMTNFDMPDPDIIRKQRAFENPPPPKTENSWLRKIITFFKKGRHNINTVTFKRIVKSAIAFFLATLLVIINPVREALSPAAYIAIVPAICYDSCRTIGAHLELTILTYGLLLIGFIVYITAFGFFILFNRNFAAFDMSGNVIYDGSFILALFLYFYTFLSGWLKCKYPKLTLPLIMLNVVLLVSLTNVPFGAKVFTLKILGSVTIPIIIGLSIALFVNVILWPESASKNLSSSFEVTLDSLHTSLKSLSDCFLLKDDTLGITVMNLEDMHSKTMTAITALIKAGKEARYEYAYSIHSPNDYKTLINLSISLRQHLGGLNLAVQRQRQLLSLKKSDSEEISPITTRSSSPTEIKAFSLPLSPSAPSLSKFSGEIAPIAHQIDPTFARDLIHDILHIVRNPLVKLSAVCIDAIILAKNELVNETLSKDSIANTKEDGNQNNCCRCNKLNKLTDETCSHNTEHSELNEINNISIMSERLKEAIVEFEIAEGRCLKLINKKLLFTSHVHSPYPEPMLVVFSGIFSIREFSKELFNLLKEEEIFLSLSPYVNKRSGFLGSGPPHLEKQMRWWKPNVTWAEWLKENDSSQVPQQIEKYESTGKDSLKKVESEFEKGKKEVENVDSQNNPIHLVNQRWAKPKFNTRGVVNQNNEKIRLQKLIDTLRFKLWNFFQSFKTFKIKFSIKLSLVTALLSFPAFVPTFAPFYSHYRGTWGTIAALLILNQTIGGTLKIGLIRLAGTLIGAIWGYLTYLASDDTRNPYIVVLMVWIYAMPSWYIMVTSSYTKIGLNGLIAYVIILFTGYNKSSSGDALVTACLRTLTVIIGLVVAMIVSTTIWPFSARKGLRKIISSLLTDIGMNFGKVAALCMSSRESPEWKELNSQIDFSNRKLQKKLLIAKTLYLYSLDEPRLKGPFQASVYSEQIRILQSMLDQLVAMTGAVSQLTPLVQQTVIFPFNSYRKFMVSSIILYFYVLSSALCSKLALPPHPPPIHAIRNQLTLKTRSAMIKRYQRKNVQHLNQSDLNKADDIKSGHDTSNTINVQSISSLNQYQKDLREEFNHIYWYTYMASIAILLEDVELLRHNIAGLVGEINIPIAEHVITFDDDEGDIKDDY